MINVGLIFTFEPLYAWHVCQGVSVMNKKLRIFINSTPVMHVCLLGQDIYVDFVMNTIL